MATDFWVTEHCTGKFVTYTSVYGVFTDVNPRGDKADQYKSLIYSL